MNFYTAENVFFFLDFLFFFFTKFFWDFAGARA